MRRLLSLLALVGASLAAPARAEVDAGVTADAAPVVTSVELSPASVELQVSFTQSFAAVARSAGGDPIPNLGFHWMSSDSRVALVDGDGVARAIAPGTAVITATCEGVSGAATLTVSTTPPAVASLTVWPESAAAGVGDSLLFRARAYNSGGGEISGLAVAWTSSDEAVAVIDDAGVAVAVGAGTTTIRAAAGGQSAEAALSVAAPSFVLRGTVRAADGAPLPGARVEVSAALADTADADGAYEILAVPAGEHDVLCTAPGHLAETAHVALALDTTLNFTLDPEGGGCRTGGGGAGGGLVLGLGLLLARRRRRG